MRARPYLSSGPPPASPTESTLGAAVHAGAVFFPFAAPIIGLAVGGLRGPSASRYVRYHAWNSLLSQLAVMAVSLTIMLLSLSFTVYKLVVLREPITFETVGWALLRGVGIWLAIAFFGLVNTIGEGFQAIRCLKGDDWGGRNPVAALARRFAGVRTSA